MLHLPEYSPLLLFSTMCKLFCQPVTPFVGVIQVQGGGEERRKKKLLGLWLKHMGYFHLINSFYRTGSVFAIRIAARELASYPGVSPDKQLLSPSGIPADEYEARGFLPKLTSVGNA